MVMTKLIVVTLGYAPSLPSRWHLNKEADLPSDLQSPNISLFQSCSGLQQKQRIRNGLAAVFNQYTLRFHYFHQRLDSSDQSTTRPSIRIRGLPSEGADTPFQFFFSVPGQSLGSNITAMPTFTG
jgi:hypothetical protein